jgi:hypothetical protein
MTTEASPEDLDQRVGEAHFDLRQDTPQSLAVEQSVDVPIDILGARTSSYDGLDRTRAQITSRIRWS